MIWQGPGSYLHFFFDKNNLEWLSMQSARTKNCNFMLARREWQLSNWSHIFSQPQSCNWQPSPLHLRSSSLECDQIDRCGQPITVWVTCLSWPSFGNSHVHNNYICWWLQQNHVQWNPLTMEQEYRKFKVLRLRVQLCMEREWRMHTSTVCIPELENTYIKIKKD